MKIFLAREGYSDDYENSRINTFSGKVLIFYDTPKRVKATEPNSENGLPYMTHSWGDARKIGEAPSYMYPEVTPNEYVELIK